MKKIVLILTSIFVITSAPIQANYSHWGSNLCWSEGNKSELKAAKQAALKSGAYIVGYALLKEYLPQSIGHVGFRDEPFSFFLPINAAMGAGAMAAWNAVKAAHHYYKYQSSRKVIGQHK